MSDRFAHLLVGIAISFKSPWMTRYFGDVIISSQQAKGRESGEWVVDDTQAMPQPCQLSP